MRDGSDSPFGVTQNLRSPVRVREALQSSSPGGAMPKFKMLVARIAPLAAIVLAAGAGGKFH
jgi:hypothetical protein